MDGRWMNPCMHASMDHKQTFVNSLSGKFVNKTFLIKSE